MERSQNPGNLKNGDFIFSHYLQVCILHNLLLSNEFLKTSKRIQEKLNFTYLRKLQKTLCLYLFHKDGE